MIRQNSCFNTFSGPKVSTRANATQLQKPACPALQLNYSNSSLVLDGKMPIGRNQCARTFWYGSSSGSRWVSFRLGGTLSTALPPSLPSFKQTRELSGAEGSGGVEAHLGHRMAALGRSTSIWSCARWAGYKVWGKIMRLGERVVHVSKPNWQAGDGAKSCRF